MSRRRRRLRAVEQTEGVALTPPSLLGLQFLRLLGDFLRLLELVHDARDVAERAAAAALFFAPKQVLPCQWACMLPRRRKRRGYGEQQCKHGSSHHSCEQVNSCCSTCSPSQALQIASREH